jgi:hypothetical protein
MAALHGKKGRAVGAGLTFEIYSWTLNATADTAESTVMDCQAVGAATHWKSHAVGFKDWTATVEGRLPAAGIGMTILGTSLALELATDVAAGGGRMYSGTALVTGIVPSTDRHDICAVTVTCQGNGQITEAAAA